MYLEVVVAKKKSLDHVAFFIHTPTRENTTQHSLRVSTYGRGYLQCVEVGGVELRLEAYQADLARAFVEWVAVCRVDSSQVTSALIDTASDHLQDGCETRQIYPLR